MPESSKILTNSFIKAVAEISESQSAILELLSAALPNLTEKERGFIKSQSTKAASRTKLFKAMVASESEKH